MPELTPQETVELWAETAFDAWVDEDPEIFEKFKKRDLPTFTLVKQAHQVGFCMGATAVLGPDPDELLTALKDL
jgi:hypothetical protein